LGSRGEAFALELTLRCQNIDANASPLQNIRDHRKDAKWVL